MIDIYLLRLLARFSVLTETPGIGCSQCLALLDRFAAFVRAGENPAAAMPAVQAHLDRCSDCRAELDARQRAARE
jgi:hypothetical protein